jgi:hypothetical protein
MVMPVILMKHKLLLIIMLLLLFLSIICQCAAGVIIRRLIKETENMAATENRMLKQCRLKYAGCFKLNGKITNTDVFVDKFLQKLEYAHLPFLRLPQISSQLMLLSVLVTGITICLCLASGDTLFQIIPYYFISILGLYLFFSVSGMVDIQGQKIILKTNLVDYLENHMMPRLEQEKEEGLKQLRESEKTVENKQQEDMLAYQEELESLLKELLA